MEAGSTTRRAAVHPPQDGLKIESLNTREIASVIIRFPTGKTLGSVAAAMARLHRNQGKIRPGQSNDEGNGPSAIPAQCRGLFPNAIANHCLSLFFGNYCMCSCVEEITGPNGQPMWVDTLEHALQHCDPTSAAGISGLGYDFLSGMSPTTVRPLLRVGFGQGRWDYAQPHHADLHALLISNRGAALDKDGSGFLRGRAVDNLRPGAWQPNVSCCS